ncbi:hypothetical protein Bca101_004777 [Brassica carinata]
MKSKSFFFISQSSTSRSQVIYATAPLRRVSWSSSVTAGEPPSSSVAKLHVRFLLCREINTNKFFFHVVLFISSPLCSWWL